MKTSHVYSGAYTLNGYITLKDCSKAIEFYKKAFGATERGRLVMPDGKIGHAEVIIEGSLLMMADENLEWGNKSAESYGGSPMSFGLYVEDADKVFQQALNAGAKEIMKVEDMFYGDRVGSVLDPFGYKWMITTHIEDVSFEEMQKRSDEAYAAQASK